MAREKTRAKLLPALVAGLAFTMAAGPAHAQSSSACLEAVDRAQELRDGGKLTAARAQLVVCSRPECPAVIRQDCARWMNDLVASTPTVVFGAQDKDGHDLFAIRVLVDGAPVAQSLDGMEVALDPGRHAVRFEAEGFVPHEETVLIRLGEKRRQLTATLVRAGSPSTPVQREPPSTAERPLPASVFVAGGLGLAVLGFAGVLDWVATADALELKRTCAPHCADAETDPIRTKYAIAGVAAGAGLVALGTAVVLYLTRPSLEAAPPPASARASSSSSRFYVPLLDVAPIDRGAVAGVRARF